MIISPSLSLVNYSEISKWTKFIWPQNLAKNIFQACKTYSEIHGFLIYRQHLLTCVNFPINSKRVLRDLEIKRRALKLLIAQSIFGSFPDNFCVFGVGCFKTKSQPDMYSRIQNGQL